MLASSACYADFELMSDEQICKQYGDRCPRQNTQRSPVQQPNYPSFYGAGPDQQYAAPIPAGGFSRWGSRNSQLVQAYDPACNCIVIIGLLQ